MLLFLLPSSGIPLISIVTLILAVVFYFVKDRFGVTFRANKSSILIALLLLTLLAWPFKFFIKKEKKSTPVEVNK